MPRDELALLGMQDIELKNMLQKRCEAIGDPLESRKFNLQTIEVSNSPGCRINRSQENNTDKVDANDTKANMPDYFRSSTNRAAHKRASKVLTNKIHNKFSDVISGTGCFKERHISFAGEGW